MMRLGAVAVAAACSLAAMAFDAQLGGDGRISIPSSGIAMGVKVYQEGWRGALALRPDPGRRFPDARTGVARWNAFPAGKNAARLAHGTVAFRAEADGAARVEAVVTSDADQKPEGVVWAVELPVDRFAGGRWTADAAQGTLPAAYDPRRLVPYAGRCRTVSVTDVKGRTCSFSFAEPVSVMIQDGRRWNGETFTMRLYSGRVPFGRMATRTFAFRLSGSEPVNVKLAVPTVIRAGPEWIPVDNRKNVAAGSALDFSNQGFLDAPAGRHGWLRNVGGHFEFADLPGVPQRFYGVNLCFGANVPDKEAADELVVRLARLGYNSIRIHHYERDLLANPRAGGLDLSPERLDRFDYLLARAIGAGFYITIDLFVSRSVSWEQIGLADGTHTGLIGDSALYKCLVALWEPAFADWCAFSRLLLEHVNPYTRRRYLDEPALPLISLINEGQLTMGWERGAKEHPVIQAAYRKWLAEKRAADPAFCPDAPDATDGLSAYAGNGAAMALFMADVERRSAGRMIAFLRGMGSKALFTNANCGPHFTPMQAVRGELYDYVDDHFYVDHPQFLEKRWRLPSRIGNVNPVLMRALPLVSPAWTRQPDRPMCVTEWNFSGPGQYRGVGGIMTGAFSALQDWDGMWRFAYAHSAENLRDGHGIPGYFNVGTDPLGQASDRASICLFLRRDLAPLAAGTAFVVAPEALAKTGGRAAAVRPKSWGDAIAWQRRVATTAVASRIPPGMDAMPAADAYGKEQAPYPAASAPGFALDRTRGTFVIDTPRTAGGFAPDGALDCGALAFSTDGRPATVWVSSVDAEKTPVREAKRLLVTHLTDVQADGNVYADDTKTVLLEWGRRPVARAGRAEVRIAHAAARTLAVWVLDTAGNRLAEIPSRVEGDRLVFTAEIAAPLARMNYEVAAR
ncbi:MAG: hypothetical protein ACI4Q3_05250 [Kiritimatiellia bacterium]